MPPKKAPLCARSMLHVLHARVSEKEEAGYTMALVNKNDCRDWFVMGTIAAAWTAATVYLFKFHSEVTFAAWCGLCENMVGAYHYINVRDQKEADACADTHNS